MPSLLPDVVDRYFETDARRDVDAVVALFTDDAVVVDVNRKVRVRAPEPNRVLSFARGTDEAAPSGGAAVGLLSVIFVGVPAVLGPVPVGVLELAVRDRL
jgi:hypothetical protein